MVRGVMKNILKKEEFIYLTNPATLFLKGERE